MSDFVKGAIFVFLISLGLVCGLYTIKWVDRAIDGDPSVAPHEHPEHRHPQRPLPQHGHPHGHDGQTMKPKTQDFRA